MVIHNSSFKATKALSSMNASLKKLQWNLSLRCVECDVQAYILYEMWEIRERVKQVVSVKRLHCRADDFLWWSMYVELSPHRPVPQCHITGKEVYEQACLLCQHCCLTVLANRLPLTFSWLANVPGTFVQLPTSGLSMVRSSWLQKSDCCSIGIYRTKSTKPSILGCALW